MYGRKLKTDGGKNTLTCNYLSLRNCCTYRSVESGSRSIMCPLRILLGLLQLHLLVLFGANATAAVNNNQRAGVACPFSRLLRYRGGHTAFVPQPNSNSLPRLGISSGRKQEPQAPIEPRVLRTTTIAVRPVSRMFLFHEDAPCLSMVAYHNRYIFL